MMMKWLNTAMQNLLNYNYLELQECYILTIFSTFCMKWGHPRHIFAGYITALIIVSAMASGIGKTAGVAFCMVLLSLEVNSYLTGES